MILQNFVVLQPNIPARLHFVDHHFDQRTIIDPRTRQPKSVRSLVFDVDSLNGAPVQTRYSILAEGLASKFAGYLNDKSYTRYDFLITQNGEGFLATYTALATPRA